MKFNRINICTVLLGILLVQLPSCKEDKEHAPTHTPSLPIDIPKDGLIAYYPFNGNANDASGHNLNGTVHGASLGEDRFENENACYAFDGIDDYISIGNSPLLRISPSITIAAWTKVIGTPHSVYLLSKVGKNPDNDFHGYQFLTFRNGVGDEYSHGIILTGTATGIHRGTGNWLSGEWTCLTVSMENDHTKIYVDGVKILDEVGSKSLANIDVTLGDLLIGKNTLEGLENPFSGLIDEVAIYNRALSELEIKDFYDLTKIE